ncbi:outer membrane protein assembly factor BamC [Kangiella sp. TOML190]|uniref:outer membrane protein assembly factor BamC n=1 Tax=Kangiella sp. TOML190 TaxID=2931351 RepID=UPI00203E4544|nr:outer membrane protein assembly factor BamC [Kangiella sp. TOML190]
MLKHNKKLLVNLSFLSLLSLSGCSWFSANDGREDIDEAYLNSRQEQALQIPADVSEIQLDDHYKIPEGAVIVNRDPKGQALTIEPPQLLLTSGDGVREDPDAPNPTVWLRGNSSRLAEFFQGFATANQIKTVATGSQRLETDWLSDEDEGLAEGLGAYNIDGQRHKFDLSLVAESANEFGVQSRHVASEQYLDGQWVPVETSKRVAKQFLNQFIGYYDGIRDKEARARILAEGNIDTRLGTNPAGHIAIVSGRDLDAVWGRTPAVLEFLNLNLTDRDKSINTFYFQVPEEEGFFSGLFGSEEEAKVDLATGSYLMELEPKGSGTSITFKTEQGDLLDPSLVGKLYPEFSAAYRSRGIK